MSEKDTGGPLLDVRGLTVDFTRDGQRTRVVRDMSFDIATGEFVGIIGETGSGKSVSLRAALRMLPRNGTLAGGTSEFRGTDLTALPAKELRRLRGARIGFIPQQPWSALNPVIRLDRQFRQVGRAHGKSRAWTDNAAREMLARVEIADPVRVLAGFSGELSGGMAQRVVIAMSLLLEPELVVADEPTTALDVTVQREILDLLSRICQEDGKSVLIVTHDLGVVAHYCDRVYVMREGRLVEEGPVDEVFASPRHEYTRTLVEAASAGDIEEGAAR
ncbi:ABC transporter ATP-binding protein [Actinomadura sp. 7K507]|uniref:ABC transporter ATP-binding protein n=1 Tax=Actinomadura sp. 7K507 TaxID=2530365 RepID=UPI0010494816|nr:ABC transporter ATP-binding protein [Actinomadura sp. 7K507]TDC90210.1 ABC transporter ATP-binding protein [Actinomadura sp. 7K507]